MSKKLLLMASPAVLVATSLTGTVAPVVKAVEADADTTIDLFKGELVDGVWVKKGEAIEGYDFSKFETPLREAGEAYGMELVDAKIKAVNMESGEEIDFGSLTEFKKESQDLFKAGNNYQFYLQGVYMLTGEGTDDSLVETDFAETDYVIVAETQAGVTDPTEPTDPVDPPTGGGDGDGKPTDPVDPPTGGGDGGGKPTDPVDPPTGGGDEDGKPTDPVDPPTGGGDGDGEQVKPPVTNPDTPTKPVEVAPGEKAPVIDNGDVSVDVGVNEPKPGTDTGDVSVDIEIKPGKPIEDGELTVIEKDKENGDKEVIKKPIGSVGKDEVVNVEVGLEEGKDYEVIITDKDKVIGSGDFHIASIEKFKYEDVKKGHWAYDDIYGATALKIVNGYKINGVNYFKPGVEVTRAQAVVMVLRSLGIEYEGYKGKGFTDAKGTWYESAVAKAKDLGIAEGYEDGKFKGNDRLSREHLAVFLNRSFIDGFDSKGANFTDVNKKHWTSPAIDAMTEIGIIEGYKDGSYKPKDNTTRAQIVAMINRTLTVDSEYVNVNKYRNSTVATSSKVSGLEYSVVDGEGKPEQTLNSDDVKTIITVK